MLRRIEILVCAWLLGSVACGGSTARGGSSGNDAGAVATPTLPAASGGTPGANDGTISAAGSSRSEGDEGAGRGPALGDGASAEGRNGGAVSAAGAAGVQNPPAGGEATGGAEAAWGGAPASAGAGGESGQGGETGLCREWPKDCAVRCQEPLGACVMDESGWVPSDTRWLSLEITQASSAHPPSWDYYCVGYLWYDQPATTLVGVDSDGKRWTLGFSSPLLPVTRFPLGSTLEVESQQIFSNQFEPTRALTVRQGGQVIGHFEAGPHEAKVPVELGLAVDEGEQACPWSLPDFTGCSFANFHTQARWQDARVDDPCSAQLGPFVVSSSFHGGRYLRECDGRMGACDAADDFLVSIVQKE